MTEEWEESCEAAASGLSRDSNPYPAATVDWTDWKGITHGTS